MSPKSTKVKSSAIDDAMLKKDKMLQEDTVLPDSVLCRHICAVGSIQQLRLCITLILIQEKPTVVHRGSLSTNHASSQLLSPHITLPQIMTSTSLYSCLCFSLSLKCFFDSYCNMMRKITTTTLATKRFSVKHDLHRITGYLFWQIIIQQENGGVFYLTYSKS